MVHQPSWPDAYAATRELRGSGAVLWRKNGDGHSTCVECNSQGSRAQRLCIARCQLGKPVGSAQMRSAKGGSAHKGMGFAAVPYKQPPLLAVAGSARVDVTGGHSHAVSVCRHERGRLRATGGVLLPAARLLVPRVGVHSRAQGSGDGGRQAHGALRRRPFAVVAGAAQARRAREHPVHPAWSVLHAVEHARAASVLRG